MSPKHTLLRIILSGAHATNSPAKWLHAGLFYVRFSPIWLKKLLIKGSTSKKSDLVQLKKNTIFWSW